MSAPGAVELLIVEDDPHDLELALRALRKANLTNRIEVARDGAEALEYMFCEDVTPGARSATPPRSCCSTSSCRRWTGLRSSSA